MLGLAGLFFGVENLIANRKYANKKYYHGMQQLRKKVAVIRDGEKYIMGYEKLVVGDLVNIYAGDEIMADCIAVETKDVFTDESSMTGESDVISKMPIADCLNKKNEYLSQGRRNTVGFADLISPVMMSGTNIKNGTGKMVVIAVGEMKVFGKIQQMIQYE